MTLHSRRILLLSIVAIGALLAVLVAAGPAPARPDKEAVLSPLGMRIDNAPSAVVGADGRKHLAYEITIVNQSSSEVSIDRVQPRSRGGSFGAAVQGGQLEGLLRVHGDGRPGHPRGRECAAVHGCDLPETRSPPRRLAHGFQLTLRAAGQPDQKMALVGVPTRVGQKRRSRSLRRCEGRAGWSATAVVIRSTPIAVRRSRSTGPYMRPSASRSISSSSTPTGGCTRGRFPTSPARGTSALVSMRSRAAGWWRCRPAGPSRRRGRCHWST